MEKHWIIFALGIGTFLMPFLGFPGGWKTFFYVAFGLSISVLMLLIIARERFLRTAPPVTKSAPRKNISRPTPREEEAPN
ncbi:MAG: hypothetical protein HY457_01690 [Parcubacteria group bacterium]|nr:hypothetical protein [Parcubacteria group bacterium]